MQIKTGHSGSNLNIDKEKSLSVVIPMYNEAARISNTLTHVFSYLGSEENTYFKTYEVIAVDDGSTDNTLEMVSAFENTKVIRLDKNYGKGKAIKEGVLQSTGDYIIYIDADNAVPLGELKLLMPFVQKYDIVIGSRKLISHAYSLSVEKNIRRLISLTGSMLNKTLVRKIVDTQCPFKITRGGLAKKIFTKMEICRYAFDLELLAIAQREGYSVKEVQVNYVSQPGSKFRIFRDVYYTFLDFVKIHLNFFFGKYK